MRKKSINFVIPFIFSVAYLAFSFFDGSLNYFNVLFLTFGIFVGVLLLYLDETYLYQYYLESHDRKPKLMTRSLLFMALLFPMGLFVVSSTASKIGIGLILGIMTSLFLELLEYSKDNGAFHERFLFQLKRKLNDQEVDYLVAIFGVASAVLVLLTFFFGR